MKKQFVAAAVMSAIVALSGPVMAYQAGDVIVRGGIATVAPDIDSGALTMNGASASTPKTTVDLESDTQIGLSVTYMVHDQIGVELLAATPFKHTIKVKGGLANLDKLADVEHLPPTLTVQYYPMESSSVFQPYVGVGLNHTIFFNEELKGTNKTTFNGIKLQKSWGLAAQLGADYRINEAWSVNAAAWYVDIETKASFKDAAGTSKYKVDVDVDPIVYMVGVAYHY